eukprot:scaffold85877_cov34-Tisochrysis_lutea.AAC.3
MHRGRDLCALCQANVHFRVMPDRAPPQAREARVDPSGTVAGEHAAAFWHRGLDATTDDHAVLIRLVCDSHLGAQIVP